VGPAVREHSASISDPPRKQQDRFLVISTALPQVASLHQPENGEEISLSQISLILTPALLICPATPTMGNGKSVQLFNSPSMTEYSCLQVPSIPWTSPPASLLVKSIPMSTSSVVPSSRPPPLDLPPIHSSLSPSFLEYPSGEGNHVNACRPSTYSPSSMSPPRPRTSSLTTTTLSNINEKLGSNGLRRRPRERWTPYPDLTDAEMTQDSDTSLDKESVWGSHCFQEKRFALGCSDTFYAVG